MKDLAQLRQEIDAIDEELCRLLCQRMDCSAAVAAYKRDHHIPVLNAGREEEVLDKIGASCRELDSNDDGYDRAARVTFSTIMDCSRALQHHRLTAENGSFEQSLNGALTALPAHPQIVCQGNPGAYSEIAARRLFPAETTEKVPQFVPAFDKVVEAVCDGRADIGILPVENSSTGSIQDVYDLIMRHKITICAGIKLPIQHSLLVAKGGSLASVQRVTSHPQALSQCKQYVDAHGWQAVPAANTATAAKLLAEHPDMETAVIASPLAAQLYGLNVADTGIQDVKRNYTRFIAITRSLCILPHANTISVSFRLPHVTGSLYRALSRFSVEGLNLTKIESRPLQNGEFAYTFYLDFEGSVSSLQTKQLLCSLAEEYPHFTFLGNYPQTEVVPGE